MSKFKVGDIVKVVDSPNNIQGMRIRKGKIDIIQNIVDVDGMQFYILTGDGYCFLWNENQLKHLEIKDGSQSDYVQGLNEGAEVILKDMIENLKKRLRKWK